jgi:cell division septation protein DedD
MRGVFDDQQLEPAQPRRDTEFTLGSGTLLLIFFGLVLLCGLCFGLGYTFGRRTPSPAASVIEPQATTSSSLSKPTASEESISTPSAPPTGSTQPEATQPGATPASAPATTPAPVAAVAPVVQPSSAPAATSAQPQVHPALVATPAAPVAQSSTPTVQPALAVPLMVQIAAVTDVEDADVLVGALRKHGYAVTARREPADNLIHVRIGPFSTREDALRWRQKLLNDGYNAIVQP